MDQTPIQWLIEQLVERGHIIPDHLEETALKKEREQRILDYNVGYNDGQCNHINDAENYVNQFKTSYD